MQLGAKSKSSGGTTRQMVHRDDELGNGRLATSSEILSDRAMVVRTDHGFGRMMSDRTGTGHRDERDYVRSSRLVVQSDRVGRTNNGPGGRPASEKAEGEDEAASEKAEGEDEGATDTAPPTPFSDEGAQTGDGASTGEQRHLFGRRRPGGAREHRGETVARTSSLGHGSEPLRS